MSHTDYLFIPTLNGQAAFDILLLLHSYGIFLRDNIVMFHI